MEFADQLSQQLLNRAGQMEGIYGRLKKSVSAEKPSDKDISAILKEIEAQNKWFEKAEVGFVRQNIFVSSFDLWKPLTLKKHKRSWS